MHISLSALVEFHKVYILCTVEVNVAVIVVAARQLLILLLHFIRIVEAVKVIVRVQNRLDLMTFHEFAEVFLRLALLHALFDFSLFLILSFESIIPVLAACLVQIHGTRQVLQLLLDLLSDGQMSLGRRMAL